MVIVASAEVSRTGICSPAISCSNLSGPHPQQRVGKGLGEIIIIIKVVDHQTTNRQQRSATWS